ncbi:autotransporter/adhesin, partial [Escherichia coli O32:H37 str. P4]
VDGDQAVVNNEGESAITNGGTGTQINGDDATANNNGKTTVDGKDSTGTEIAGNNGKYSGRRSGCQRRRSRY